MYNYLQNVKTNVSNAKSQRILKIKIILIFHSITPILSRIEANATLQHGCHVVSYHIHLYSTIFISYIFLIIRLASDVISQCILLFPIKSFTYPALQYHDCPVLYA